MPLPVTTQRLLRWPLLSETILQPSAGSRLCLTCRWFHHQAEVDDVPVLACRRHRALLSHGEHLSRCCGAWSDRRAEPITASRAA